MDRSNPPSGHEYVGAPGQTVMRRVHDGTVVAYFDRGLVEIMHCEPHAAMDYLRQLFREMDEMERQRSKVGP